MDDNKGTNGTEDIVIMDNRTKGTGYEVGCLLFLILLLNTYLCFETYRKNNYNEYIDSNHRVLVLFLETNIKDSENSDKTQISNALNNGGAIRIGIKDCDKIFEAEYQRYGATDSNKQFWTLGAILNYIASRGWKMVQADSDTFTKTYYFSK